MPSTGQSGNCSLGDFFFFFFLGQRSALDDFSPQCGAAVLSVIFQPASEAGMTRGGDREEKVQDGATRD